MGADVCDPVADECQKPVEAAGSQLAERDFRPQAGQVRLAVEPRDAQGVQALGQPGAVYCWRLYGGVRHMARTRTSRAGGPPCGLAYRASTPRQREPSIRAESASTVNDG